MYNNCGLFKVLLQLFPRDSEENHEKLKNPNFKAENFPIESRNVKLSTTKFGA
jgi:hypothetical protein